MNKLFCLFLIILLPCLNLKADKIYIPPGACITVPYGSRVCADTLFVDSAACFIAEDTSAVCPGIVIQGSGQVIIAIGNISNEIPVVFKLYQNYPNPFNPTTNIQFDIPKTSLVKLMVYDILGREATILLNEELKAGTYNYDWDATNFASGIYYYKLSASGGAGDFVETKKMVLIK